MLLLHLAAILAVGLAGWLGWWQVGAWQEHRHDRAAEIARQPPVPLGDLIGPDDAFPRDGVGRPVEVSGRWLPGFEVYVEDKPHAGQHGYWIVGILETCGSSPGCAQPSGLPVVLGWSADPSYDTMPTGAAGVTGWLQPGEGTDGSDTDPSDDVLPSLRVPSLLSRVDGDVYGAYLMLGDPPSGLEPVTPASLPKPSSFTALRNLLYGIEWWFFGAFAVYVWWRWCRDELAAGRVSPVSEDAEEARDELAARLPSEP